MWRLSQRILLASFSSPLRLLGSRSTDSFTATAHLPAVDQSGGGALFRASSVLLRFRERFDLKEHELLKRRQRESEIKQEAYHRSKTTRKPFLKPLRSSSPVKHSPHHSRAAVPDEEMQRRQEAFLKLKEEEESEKREKFKAFRAKQIAMSQSRKDAVQKERRTGSTREWD